MDNGDPGTSEDGSWEPIKDDDCYGSGAVRARQSGSYTFAPALEPGLYRIHLWWVAREGRARDVPVTIKAASGDVVVSVNQRRQGGRWNLLGEFDLDESSQVTLEANNSRFVCADAVRFELLGGASSPPADEPPTTPPPAPVNGFATLGWDAPTTNEDGSTLTDLAGYKVHYGTAPGRYDNHRDVGTVKEFTIDSLGLGTHYFAVTAYDTSGNESAFSNEVFKTIQ